MALWSVERAESSSPLAHRAIIGLNIERSSRHKVRSALHTCRVPILGRGSGGLGGISPYKEH
jgi:hypothetical protein